MAQANTPEHDHQYQADKAGLAGVPDRTWREGDHYDHGSPLGLHDTTLFDQGESAAGSSTDEATGESYGKPVRSIAPILSEVIDIDEVIEDGQLSGYEQRLEEELDIAEAHLDEVERERFNARTSAHRSRDVA